jgi:hypothetical protein
MSKANVTLGYDRPNLLRPCRGRTISRVSLPYREQILKLLLDLGSALLHPRFNVRRRYRPEEQVVGILEIN